MSSTYIDSLITAVCNNTWFFPVASFLAGFLTSLAPCSLMSVPLVINHVKGSDNKTSVLKMSFIFALGMAIAYTALGITASVIGNLLELPERTWHIFLGIISILMAVQMLNIYNFIPTKSYFGKTNKTGYIGSFITGIIGGLFSSHHAAPVLVILLGLIAQNKSIITGIMILLFFSIGHSIIIITAAFSAGFIKKFTGSEKYAYIAKLINYLLGFSTVLLGIYLLYTAF